MVGLISLGPMVESSTHVGNIGYMPRASMSQVSLVDTAQTETLQLGTGKVLCLLPEGHMRLGACV